MNLGDISFFIALCFCLDYQYFCWWMWSSSQLILLHCDWLLLILFGPVAFRGPKAVGNVREEEQELEMKDP